VYSVEELLFGQEIVTFAVDVATCVRANVWVLVDTEGEFTVQLENSAIEAAIMTSKRLFFIFIL